MRLTNAGQPRLSLALRPLLAVALLSLADRSAAQCVALPRDGGFEQQANVAIHPPWVLEGSGRNEFTPANAHSGSRNAALGNAVQWNAVRQRVRLRAGVNYTLRVWVRTTGNVQNGYFGFRGTNGVTPVSERKFGPVPGWTQLQVAYRPPATAFYTLFVGFHAPDTTSRLRVDDVRLVYPCEDQSLNPVP